jgi:hypothetical protein
MMNNANFGFKSLVRGIILVKKSPLMVLGRGVALQADIILLDYAPWRVLVLSRFYQYYTSKEAFNE